MKAAISTTFDDTYLFYLPITTWCWNKLGVGVICFMPRIEGDSMGDDVVFSFGNISSAKKFVLINNTIADNIGDNKVALCFFDAPEHKQATCAQVSRLYGACLDLPEDEVLITSDIDMLCFGNIFRELNDGHIHIIGSDLLDESMKQIPMCYISMSVKQWREIMKIEGKSYQECLDESVGKIECENFRGNQWSLDQNIAYNHLEKVDARKHSRAKMPERFATHRIDRDDMFWEERLNWDVVDYHCHRPGYTDENFEKILTVIKYFYPHDDLTWMRNYQQAYKQLI